MEALSSAVGTVLTGAGAMGFVHRLWWHMASILGIAWVATWSAGGTPLNVVAGWMGYLGLPEAVRNIPLGVHDWLLERPGLEYVVPLVAVAAFLVHVRPWGEDWTDAAKSPAGASCLVALVCMWEYSIPSTGRLWTMLAVAAAALGVKWRVHGGDALGYAVVSVFLTFMHTPIALLVMLLAPARESQPLPVQVAEGSRLSDRPLR